MLYKLGLPLRNNQSYFDDVLSGTITASAVSMMDEDVVETPSFKSEPEPSIPEVSQEEDDDTMSYFQKLAKE